MAKKEFDAKEFQKSQNKLLLFSLAIGAIGLASIISGATINTTVNRAKDPKDYYGSYYGVVESNFIEYKFDAKKCKTTTSLDIPGTELYDEFDYEYCSADYAQKLYPNEEQDGNDAIFLKDPNGDKDKNIVLWVNKDGDNYSFTEGKYGTKFTKTKKTLQQLMNDPKDYYGTYTYNTATATFTSDYELTLFSGAETEKYSYICVNKDWMEWEVTGHYFNEADYFLIAYEVREDKKISMPYMFAVLEDGRLGLYQKNYSFYYFEPTTPKEIKLTEIKLNAHELELDVNSIYYLTYNLIPSDAAKPTLSWSSSNTSVAKVSNTGTVTAIGEGTATIKVKTSDGKIYDTCKITVKKPVSPTPKTGLDDILIEFSQNITGSSENEFEYDSSDDSYNLTIRVYDATSLIDAVEKAEEYLPSCFVSSLYTKPQIYEMSEGFDVALNEYYDEDETVLCDLGSYFEDGDYYVHILVTTNFE